MRIYTLTLAQNSGDGSLGNTLDLSDRISELGSIKWEVDEQLTKLSPGDFSPTILDYDGSIWAWLQSQTPIAGALYPPFLALDIDGVRKFTGLVLPEKASRDQKTGVLSLTAQDWSLMLAGNALDTWLKAPPKAASNRTGETRVCTVSSHTVGNYSSNPIDGGYIYGLPGAAEWLHAGDVITWDKAPGQSFKVLNSNLIVFPDPSQNRWRSDLGIDWGLAVFAAVPSFPGYPNIHTAGADNQTITRPAVSNMDTRAYYLTTAAVAGTSDAPVYEIPLDTVDGLVPGDELQLLRSAQSAKWTILQVDPAGLKVVTKEPVASIPINSMVYFTDDCLKEVVFADARDVLRRACLPFSCDFPARYTPPTLPVPVVVWLPLRPMDNGADLSSVRDLDAGLTSLRVFGSGAVGWDGSPESGWTQAAGSAPRAYWTDQKLAAPASLMPDETLALSPATPRRYRPIDLKYRARPKDAEDTAAGTDPGVWSATAIPKVVLYDYLAMRRVQLAGTAVSIHPWTGSAWGALTSVTWPGGSPVESACVFPDGPAGMILGLSASGLVGAVLPGLAPQTPAWVAPQSAGDAVLRSTPWGAYLVGSKGYGRVSYAAGALSVAWCELMEPGINSPAPPDSFVPFGAGTLYPGTFAAVDANTVMVLARYEAMDSENKIFTETHMLLVKASSTAGDATASLVWDEKIFDGAPITLGAVRDPSLPNRAIGHCGGRLFQVSSTLPLAYALERFTPSSMNSSELLEHVCQMIHAVAVPDALGSMQIVSRSSLAAAQPFTVDSVEITDTRAWEHFYSIVRVTGATADLFYDARSATSGGKLLEVTQHPLIWGNSGLVAMGESLAAWFGKPRRLQQQAWFWTDPNTAAPWESLAALAPLNINGDTVTRMLTALEYWPEKGEATATLVEV